MAGSLRRTSYADEITNSAVIDFPTRGSQGRLEHLRFKKGPAKNREGYRFSWWNQGRMAPRPADFTEDELLRLFKKAIEEHVLSSTFMKQLRDSLPH
jgi:hypothetical protein